MKKITAEMFNGFEVNKDGYKLCIHGDYTDIREFGDKCIFESGCIFGDNSEFGDNNVFKDACRFGIKCSFGDMCVFGEYNKFSGSDNFGASCKFGDSCEFGTWCDIKEHSVIGSRCVFLSYCNVIESEISEVVHTVGDVCFNHCSCSFGEIEDIISLEFLQGCSFNIIMLTTGDAVFAAYYGDEKICVLNDEVEEFISKVEALIDDESRYVTQSIGKFKGLVKLLGCKK